MKLHPPARLTPSPTPKPTPTRMAGMTLAELLVAIVVTSILGLAAMTFTTAVASGWHATGNWSRASMSTQMTAKQIESNIANVLTISQVNQGRLDRRQSAYAVMWNADDVDSLLAYADDGYPQFGELSLLDFDHSRGELVIYRVDDFSRIPLLSKVFAQVRMTRESMRDDANLANSIRNSSIFTKTVLMTGVEAVQLDFQNANATTKHPKLAYAIRFNKDQGVRGVVTLEKAADEDKLRQIQLGATATAPLSLLPNSSGGGGLFGGGFGGFGGF